MRTLILMLLISILSFSAYSQNIALLEQINGFKKIKLGMTSQQVKLNEFKYLYDCPLVDNQAKGYNRYEFYKGRLYYLKIEVEGDCSLDVYNNLRELFEIKKTLNGSTTSSFSFGNDKIEMSAIFIEESEDNDKPTCFITVLDLSTYKLMKRAEKQKKINEISN